jgi:hypothetical protein
MGVGEQQAVILSRSLGYGKTPMQMFIDSAPLAKEKCKWWNSDKDSLSVSGSINLYS